MTHGVPDQVRRCGGEVVNTQDVVRSSRRRPAELDENANRMEPLPVRHREVEPKESLPRAALNTRRAREQLT